MRTSLSLLILTAMLSLTACGQSGPLTLPPSKPTPKVVPKPNVPVPPHMTGNVPSMPQQTNNNQL